MQERSHILTEHRSRAVETPATVGIPVPLANAGIAKPTYVLGMRSRIFYICESILRCNATGGGGSLDRQAMQKSGHILTLHRARSTKRICAIVFSPTSADACMGKPQHILSMRSAPVDIGEYHPILFAGFPGISVAYAAQYRFTSQECGHILALNLFVRSECPITIACGDALVCKPYDIVAMRSGNRIGISQHTRKGIHVVEFGIFRYGFRPGIRISAFNAIRMARGSRSVITVPCLGPSIVFAAPCSYFDRTAPSEL